MSIVFYLAYIYIYISYAYIGIQSDMEESATTLLVILGGSPNDAQTRPRLATPELSREEFREPEHVFYLTS